MRRTSNPISSPSTTTTTSSTSSTYDLRHRDARPVLAPLPSNLRRLPSRTYLKGSMSDAPGVVTGKRKRIASTNENHATSGGRGESSRGVGRRSRKRVRSESVSTDGGSAMDVDDEEEDVERRGRRHRGRVDSDESDKVDEEDNDEDQVLDDNDDVEEAEEDDDDDVEGSNSDDSSDEHLIHAAPPRRLLRFKKPQLAHLYTAAGLTDSDPAQLTKAEIVQALVNARDDIASLPPSSPPRGDDSGSECGGSSDGTETEDEDQVDETPRRGAGGGRRALKRRSTYNNTAVGGGRAGRAPNGRTMSMGNLNYGMGMPRAGPSSASSSAAGSSKSTATNTSTHSRSRTTSRPSPPATRLRTRQVSTSSSLGGLSLTGLAMNNAPSSACSSTTTNSKGKGKATPTSSTSTKSKSTSKASSRSRSRTSSTSKPITSTIKPTTTSTIKPTTTSTSKPKPTLITSKGKSTSKPTSNSNPSTPKPKSKVPKPTSKVPKPTSKVSKPTSKAPSKPRASGPISEDSDLTDLDELESSFGATSLQSPLVTVPPSVVVSPAAPSAAQAVPSAVALLAGTRAQPSPRRLRSQDKAAPPAAAVNGTAPRGSGASAGKFYAPLPKNGAKSRYKSNGTVKAKSKSPMPISKSPEALTESPEPEDVEPEDVEPEDVEPEDAEMAVAAPVSVEMAPVSAEKSRGRKRALPARKAKRRIGSMKEDTTTDEDLSEEDSDQASEDDDEAGDDVEEEPAEVEDGDSDDSLTEVEDDTADQLHDEEVDELLTPRRKKARITPPLALNPVFGSSSKVKGSARTSKGKRGKVVNGVAPDSVGAEADDEADVDEEEEEESFPVIEEEDDEEGEDAEEEEDEEESRTLVELPRKLRNGKVVGESDVEMDVDEEGDDVSVVSAEEEDDEVVEGDVSIDEADVSVDGSEISVDEGDVSVDGSDVSIDEAAEDDASVDEAASEAASEDIQDGEEEDAEADAEGDEEMDDYDLTDATKTSLLRLRRPHLLQLCEARSIEETGTKAQLADALLAWRDDRSAPPDSTATVRPPSTKVPTHRRRSSRSSAIKTPTQRTPVPILERSHRVHLDEPRTPPVVSGSGAPEGELELDLESLGLDDREIPPDKLTKMEKIGSGGFKDVFVGKYKGRKVAIAEFRGQLSSMDIKELKLLGGFNHPNIVRFIGVSIPENTKDVPVMIVSELCSNGDLFDYVRNIESPPTLYKVLSIMLDIAHGLAYLHACKPSVIHRDCKSSNILITSKGVAKIADFGLAKVKQSTRSMVRSLVGTVNWQAPELWHAHPKYNHKVDVFSCGMVYWEMMQWAVPGSQRKYPWEGMNEHAIYEIVGQKRQRPPVGALRKHWGNSIVDLVERMWAHEHQDRPTMDEVVQELEVLVKEARR